LAGGAYKNEARVFNEDQVICKITGMVKPVITCDWSHANDKFVIGGADGFLRIFSIDLNKTDPQDDMN
jgi:WD40 repeat protein